MYFWRLTFDSVIQYTLWTLLNQAALNLRLKWLGQVPKRRSIGLLIKTSVTLTRRMRRNLRFSFHTRGGLQYNQALEIVYSILVDVGLQRYGVVAITLPARRTRRPIRDRRVTAHCCDWWRARVPSSPTAATVCVWRVTQSRPIICHCDVDFSKSSFVEHLTVEDLLELAHLRWVDWSVWVTASVIRQLLCDRRVEDSRIIDNARFSLWAKLIMDYAAASSFLLAIRIIGKTPFPLFYLQPV